MRTVTPLLLAACGGAPVDDELPVAVEAARAFVASGTDPDGACTDEPETRGLRTACATEAGELVWIDDEAVPRQAMITGSLAATTLATSLGATRDDEIPGPWTLWTLDTLRLATSTPEGARRLLIADPSRPAGLGLDTLDAVLLDPRTMPCAGDCSLGLDAMRIDSRLVEEDGAPVARRWTLSPLAAGTLPPDPPAGCAVDALAPTDGPTRWRCGDGWGRITDWDAGRTAAAVEVSMPPPLAARVAVDAVRLGATDDLPCEVRPDGGFRVQCILDDGAEERVVSIELDMEQVPLRAATRLPAGPDTRDSVFAAFERLGCDWDPGRMEFDCDVWSTGIAVDLALGETAEGGVSVSVFRSP